MKKCLAVCLAVVMVGFATGCGSDTKTLTCTMNQNVAMMDMKQTVNVTFKKDSVTKMEIVQDVKVSDSYASYMDEIKESLEDEMESYKEMGLNVTTKTNGNNIKVSMTADLTKMSDKDKENLDLLDAKGSRSDAKKAFEDAGYTCK